MTLQLLQATFDLPLHPRDIHRWRGAWAEMAGLEYDIFHNHQPGDRNYYHRYPLVQYRAYGRKAGILAINEATQQVQRALTDSDWTIRWDGEPTPLGVERLRLENYELHMPRTPVTYRVRRYLPFNDANYAAYQNAPDLHARIDQLERLLVGHLLGCCEALAYRLPERLELQLTDWDRSSFATLHGLKRPAFDLRFRTNLFLPDGLAIGKGMSHGFGVLRRWRERPQIFTPPANS